jgi:hypothetical protein
MQHLLTAMFSLQVDVRLLKTQIWGRLTDSIVESSEADGRVADVKSFQETVQAVPAALPGQVGHMHA